MKNIKEPLSDFEVKIYNDMVILNFNYLIMSYQRHRKGLYGSIYDPLNTYKKKIRKFLKEEFKDFELLNGSIEFELYLYSRIPKGYSKKRILNILRKNLKLKTKPDIDNTLKTSLDLFKDIIWVDDCQVNKIISTKSYDIEDKTMIVIKFNRKENDTLYSTGRITKEDNLTDEEEELIKKVKNGK